MSLIFTHILKIFFCHDYGDVQQDYEPIPIPHQDEVESYDALLSSHWCDWYNALADGEPHANAEKACIRLQEYLQHPDTAFDLSGLRLPSLPEHWPQAILTLKLNNCHLTAIPSELRALVIKKLHLSGNALTSVTNTDLPSQLEELIISHNQLKGVETLPQYLNVLDISHNHISNIEGCPLSLQRLRASHNQIAHLGGLPPGIKELIIHHNPAKISTLPSNLHQLETLHLSAAQLDDVHLLGKPRLKACIISDHLAENVDEGLFALLLTSRFISPIATSAQKISKPPSNTLTEQRIAARKSISSSPNDPLCAYGHFPHRAQRLS